MQLTFDAPGIASTMPPLAKAHTIIKWAGGKRWVMPHIVPGIYRRLARTGGRYVEPFLGGAAVALELGQPKMVLGDLCEPLIAMYRAVQRDPAAVAWALSALATKGVDEATYYEVRDSRPVAPVLAAARFIYLNKLCFNGLYRENKSGGFNVPYGDAGTGDKSREEIAAIFPSEDRLVAASEAFRGVKLVPADFRAVLGLAREGDLVFCDPPYADTFSAYTSAGFSAGDQADLSEHLCKLAGAGAHIVSTNNDTPLIRDLYKWATVLPTAELRAINSDGDGRGRSGCLIITSDQDLLG